MADILSDFEGAKALQGDAHEDRARVAFLNRLVKQLNGALDAAREDGLTVKFVVQKDYSLALQVWRLTRYN